MQRAADRGSEAARETAVAAETKETGPAVALGKAEADCSGEARAGAAAEACRVAAEKVLATRGAEGAWAEFVGAVAAAEAVAATREGGCSSDRGT